VADPLPLANLITLGARDFGALRDFYRRVGWPQVMDDGEFAVFELRGIVLALFPLTKLAHDGNAEPEPSTGGIRFTIPCETTSGLDVDRVRFAVSGRSRSGRGSCYDGARRLVRAASARVEQFERHGAESAKAPAAWQPGIPG
jgi:hypothetical protein